MPEHLVTSHSYNPDNGALNASQLKQPVETTGGELNDDQKSTVGSILNDQLWSSNPKKIVEALQGAIHLLEDQTDVFDVAYDVVDKNLDRLMEISECGDALLEPLAMQTIYDAWTRGNRNDPHIVAAFKSLLPKIIAHYPKSRSTKIFSLEALAQDFIDDFTHPLTALVKNNVLEAFGYDQSTAVLAEYWQDGMKKTHLKKDVALAMQVMSALEKAEPGTVNSLNKSNSIRNFQRYTPDMLYQMHRDQIEHPEKDYVLLIQSVSDHNDAFKRPDTYSKLYTRLKKMGYGLRIYECGDLDELDAITEKVLHDYTDHGAKVVSELILGHGEEDSVELSTRRHTRAMTQLTARHLDKTIHGNIIHAMTKGAWTRFVSCSTGKETKNKLCISKEVAIIMGKMATAPTAKVSFGKMRPIKSGDGVNVMVEYMARKGRRNGKAHHVRSKPAVYNGKTEQSQREPLNDEVDSSDVWGEWDVLPLDSYRIEYTDLTDELPTDVAF